MANTARGAARPEGAVGHQQLGAQVRAERQRRALSVRELARRIGVSASLISQVETGRAQPSVTTLMALVTELELSLDSLFSDGAPGGSSTTARAGSARRTLAYRRRRPRLGTSARGSSPAWPKALMSIKERPRLSCLSATARQRTTMDTTLGLTTVLRGPSRPAGRLHWRGRGSLSGWKERASVRFWSSSPVSAGSASLRTPFQGWSSYMCATRPAPRRRPMASTPATKGSSLVM